MKNLILIPLLLLFSCMGRKPKKIDIECEFGGGTIYSIDENEYCSSCPPQMDIHYNGKTYEGVQVYDIHFNKYKVGSKIATKCR